MWVFCIAGGFFTVWAPRETQFLPLDLYFSGNNQALENSSSLYIAEQSGTGFKPSVMAAEPTILLPDSVASVYLLTPGTCS